MGCSRSQAQYASVVTNAQLLPFWSAAAQVIPVLALAMVIEARIVARRLADKRVYERLWARVVVAIAFFAIAVALFNSELHVLTALLSEPEEAPTEELITGVWWTLGSIAAALIFVFMFPVIGVAETAVHDVFHRVAIVLPLSSPQKQRRALEKAIRIGEEFRMEARESRHSSLMLASSLALDASRLGDPPNVWAGFDVAWASYQRTVRYHDRLVVQIQHTTTTLAKLRKILKKGGSKKQRRAIRKLVERAGAVST